MNIPLLLLIYNRPSETKKLIEKLRRYKPSIIYVSSDGVKKNQKNSEKNTKVKNIIKEIDWKCKIKTHYLNKNYGCKEAVSRGITWFFKNEKMGIILEDDCIPSKSFFIFSKNLLKKYYNNNSIFTISGNNFLKKNLKIKDSYYFSNYNHCWGWATWRKAWKKYDKNLKKWPSFKKTKKWENKFIIKEERKYWEKIFDLCYKKKIDSWAYPWLFSILYNDGTNILPRVNLVKNIGFNLSADTTIGNKKFNHEIFELKKELIHPKKISINLKADEYTYFNFFEGRNFMWPYRIFYLIELFLHNPYIFIKRMIKKIY
tara:strand:- start:425 stop:1369 length:945 start_codon:yes stop_codon:yes gene_type:complete